MESNVRTFDIVTPPTRSLPVEIPPYLVKVDDPDEYALVWDEALWNTGYFRPAWELGKKQKEDIKKARAREAAKAAAQESPKEAIGENETQKAKKTLHIEPSKLDAEPDAEYLAEWLVKKGYQVLPPGIPKLRPRSLGLAKREKELKAKQKAGKGK